MTLLCDILTDSPMEEQFFIANNTSSDDDAAFKERLKNMGKGMKTKMIRLEERFPTYSPWAGSGSSIFLNWPS